MKTVVMWTNGRGEHITSEVITEFKDGGKRFCLTKYLNEFRVITVEVKYINIIEGTLVQ